MSTPSIHLWSRCHNCGMSPIVGPCFRCESCPLGPDVDLCTSCYEGYREGRVVHPAEDVAASLPGRHTFARLEGSAVETFAPWLSISGSVAPSPDVPSGFLVRPEFRTGRESVFGGYSFVTTIDAHILLLTALHVMDELIKKKQVDSTSRNAAYTGAEIPPHVSSVRLYDLTKNPWALHEVGTAGAMLVLPNARTNDDEPFSFRDIAAFRVTPQPKLHPLPLAQKDPEPGDPLWLAAAMQDGTRTRRAVCVERTSRTFIFRYEEAKQIPKHTSGAPLLDRHGAVVGINTGLGQFEAHEFGHANPVSSIRAHLEPAL
jgi:hypothetical protein